MDTPTTTDSFAGEYYCSPEQNFGLDLPKPFFILAPMEDVTDVVFRHVISEAAKPDVFFTEFTSTESYCHPVGTDSTRGRLKFTEDEQPIVAHIWGNKPALFEQMSIDMKKLGFRGIDLNMGCPVQNVASNGKGAGLIQHPEVAADWLGHILKQDIANLSIHLDIPDRATGLKLVEQYGVDGIMIGRGIFTNSFAFEQEPKEHSAKEFLIAEVVYVLEKVYKVERVHIFDSLRNLLSYSNISVHDKNILIEALKVYSEIKIDFVDSLLFAYSKIGRHTVFTFDKKLNQMLDELRNA
jgi:tRNA-dihydrouridine synthase